MNISDQTLSSIKTRIIPPYCSSLDMAEVIIKRFLQRSSFVRSDLETLSEEDGQRLLTFLKTVFSQDLKKQAFNQIVAEKTK